MLCAYCALNFKPVEIRGGLISGAISKLRRRWLQPLQDLMPQDRHKTRKARRSSGEHGNCLDAAYIVYIVRELLLLCANVVCYMM